MSPSSTSGDLPPSAAARPPLPSKASAPSVLAAPSKKRKTAHQDSANSDAAANPLVTPPPPRTNISRAEMPPRIIAYLPAVATARRAPAGGLGGAGDAPDAPNLTSPSSKPPSTPGAEAGDPASSPGLEPSTEEVADNGRADEAPLDGGQAPWGVGGVSASPNASSLANMLPPMVEVEAGKSSHGDDGEPEPSAEEAAAGGEDDDPDGFMEEALRQMEGGGNGMGGGGNGSDSSESSISSDISTTSAYINQQEHLLATGRSARTTYEAHIKEQGVEFSLCLLLTMATGELSDEEASRNTIDEYVTKGWLSLSSVRVTVNMIREELTRRFDIACECEDVKPKKPRVTGTAASLKSQLDRLQGTFPLTYVSERRYLVRKIKEILRMVERNEQEKQDAKMERGDHLYLTTLVKMRIMHAVFEDSRRPKLQRMYDSLSRKQLDDRNSGDNIDLWDEVCQDYNSEAYSPTSFTFPDLHSKFRLPVSLPRPVNFEPLSPETAKRVIKDLNSKFKKAYTNWKASGNGKDDEAEDGHVVRLLLQGTEYPDVAEEANTIIKYVDDDRFHFCSDDLTIAYFWGLVELVGLTAFCMQDIASVGLVDGGVGSARAVVSKGMSARFKHRESLEKAIRDLPHFMERSMSAFLKSESNEKRMSEREEHCRRAADHYANMSNDYESATLKMMEYKFGDNPNPDVLAFHEKIVRRRKKCVEAAADDVERCVHAYNHQRSQNGSEKEEQNDDTDQSDGSLAEGGSVIGGSVKTSVDKTSVDSDVSLVDQGEERDITTVPSHKMVAASEREMAMEE